MVSCRRFLFLLGVFITGTETVPELAGEDACATWKKSRSYFSRFPIGGIIGFFKAE